MTYAQWIGIIWPLLAVTVVFILAYLFFGVKETDVQLKDIGEEVKVSRITRYLLPYIFGVAAVIYGIDFLWAFGSLTVYYMVVTKTFDIPKLLRYVDWKIIIWVAIIIFVANIARQNTDAIKTFLSDTGMDINTWTGFLYLTAISFAGSFALGSSSRFGALMIIMTSIYGIQYLPWFFAIDFVGYLISPMHKCVTIGMLYFGTKLRYYITILGMWGGLVIAAAALTL